MKVSHVVQVKNIKIGEGLPKIAIPLTAVNINELRNEGESVLQYPCDLIEWRGDHYEGVKEKLVRQEALTYFAQRLPSYPLLFTIRTAQEGGAMDISTDDYKHLLLSAIEAGGIDLIDVELSRGNTVVKDIVAAAHEKGIKVIGSCHDFQKTPPKSNLVEAMCQMQELGCDIAKYAVMPHSSRDVLTLLDASLEMNEKHGTTPVITMSMGPLGAISRICGSVFKSAITFGTAGKSSAPGQLPADKVAEILRLLAY